MHVAFIITRGDAVGGATIHVRDMARRLIESGEQATVLVGGEGEAAEEFARYRIPVRQVASLGREIHPLHDFRALLELASELRRIAPDLVSTHTAKAGLLGRAAARLVGLPVLYTPHGWAISDRISKAGGRVFRIAERMAAPLASAIVNVCEAEKSLALEHRIAGNERLAVIHNGVCDLAGCAADPAVQPPRLVMVARFEEPKDHSLLLRALERIKSDSWTIEFVGAGPKQPETQRLAGELGLAERVFFTGACGSVAERLAKAQLFVLASRSEGFPRSILEAMRAGLPVVASDAGGIAEAVRHGETGLMVPRNDEAALAGALRRLINDPASRVSYGRAARSRYERNFTFENMHAMTVALYHHVLRRQASLAVNLEGLHGIH